eukprot:838351-Amphidinium_carterae.1
MTQKDVGLELPSVGLRVHVPCAGTEALDSRGVYVASLDPVGQAQQPIRPATVPTRPSPRAGMHRKSGAAPPRHLQSARVMTQQASHSRKAQPGAPVRPSSIFGVATVPSSISAAKRAATLANIANQDVHTDTLNIDFAIRDYEGQMEAAAISLKAQLSLLAFGSVVVEVGSRC